jgi:hypothetical protein
VLGVADSAGGTLSPALHSLADFRPNAVRDPEEEQARSRNSVNIVRNGVTTIQSAK